MECIYSNIDQTWRVGCANTSRYSPPVVVPVSPPPPSLDVWESCDELEIDPYYDLTVRSHLPLTR